MTVSGTALGKICFDTGVDKLLDSLQTTIIETAR
jgi:hypothetical protein